MTRKVELPIFHLGTYTSSNGQPVTFTPELLRQLERNTKLVIRMSKFQPPVGYDHPAARDTNAHGFISDVRYDNGKLIAVLDGTSDKLREDAKAFRRLTYSPEFHENYSFVHDGKPVKVGPTVIGLAMLGAQRGAIKNTAMVPLSEVPFGEAVSDVEALLLREDLRAMGYVGEYVVEGKFFGEVENDASRFFEEEQEQPMTAEEKAEFQRMLDAQATSLKAGFEAQIAAVKSDAEKQIAAFSETEQKKSQVLAKVKTIADEKKLGKIATEKLEAAALNPTTENVLAFGEVLSSVVLPGGSRKEGKLGDDDGDDTAEEPAALAKLRVKHFSDIDRYQNEIAEGVTCFGEFKPEVIAAATKGKTGLDAIVAQREALKRYVHERDTAAN